MSLYRSEPMKYYKVAMPREMAWDVLNELGMRGLNQFVDQNEQEPMFQRKYAQMIKRCDEVEVQLASLVAALDRFQIPVDKCEHYKDYLRNLQKFLDSRNKSAVSYLEEVETEVDTQHAKLQDQIARFDQMEEQLAYLKEYRQVLVKNESVIESYLKDIQGQGLDAEGLSSRALRLVFGVVARAQVEQFKRMVFRASKGCVLIYTFNFEENTAQAEEGASDKCIFMLTFQDSALHTLNKKVARICDALSVKQYDVPMDRKKFKAKLEEIEGAVLELEQSSALTRKHLRGQLAVFSERRDDMECSYVEHLSLFMVKEKCLYQNMNLLRHNEYDYTGYCWVAAQDEDFFKTAINQLQARHSHIKGVTYQQQHEQHSTPPTYFKTNAFTAPFQEIVNTYGIPRYGEINPGLFAIAFFPFLFGVMFGDIGHGGLLFLFGLYLVFNAESIKEDKESSLGPLVEMRYLLAIMGFFALYGGFIYNEFFAITWNLFGSCYEDGEHFRHRISDDCVYPFGIDPKWFGTSNELAFFNSFKMKMAVIIGVAQMSFGVVLKGLNSINFGLPLDFLFEFLPQLTFLLITFGYMCFCVVFKWLTPWESFDLNTHPAPGIINIMINMPLKMGSTEGEPLFDTTTQEQVQFYFFLSALIMVPIMLFVKPLILLCQNSGASKKNENEPLLVKDSHGHGEFDFGEIFVHQVIETIEFVLGSISNTASYLRLWALSLAHGQLSKVFFEKTLAGGLETGSVLMTFVGFFMFANITFAVIMCMDSMECFLHALRLQWVEFQNKFFKADGYKFAPFDFEKAIVQANTAN